MQTVARVDKAIQYYLDGHSLKKTAHYIGLSSGTSIKRMLVARGIPRRQRVPEFILDLETVCPRCGTPFIRKGRINGKRNKRIGFCSRSCANSRKQSEEIRLKISEGVKAHIKKYGQPDPDGFLNNPRFNSKGEIEVREHFPNKYPDDGWIFGGGLKVGDKRISRDLYSKSLKVCIEYDGIWHFKDIHGQLANKQLKDALLEFWCRENGYRLIRIEDRLFKTDKVFWLKKLEDEVYQNSTPLVKFYDPSVLKGKYIL